MTLDADKILKSSLGRLNIIFTDKQVNTLIKYLDFVYENNKKINLVGTKDKQQILVRHILDSLSILRSTDCLDQKNKNTRILDIGTGAGFPGIVIAVFLKGGTVYLLDKSLKKINFIRAAVEELNLKNVEVVRGRAEELSRETLYREGFDVVLARAVAKFNVLCELAIPFCRINGKIIFYKSRNIFKEIIQYKEAISKLGGEVEDLLEVKVPYLDDFRSFLVINKLFKTPGIYPRRYSKIKHRPL